DLTYVQVHTDEGLVGVGETRMLSHTQALLGYLAEAAPTHVLGRDPFDIESLVRRMKYGGYGWAGDAVMGGLACVGMGSWDMYGRSAPHEAVRIPALLEPFAPSWIEEPVPPENLAALAKVAGRITLPIATGERIHDRIEFRELFELRTADIIQPDIGHLGGIL